MAFNKNLNNIPDYDGNKELATVTARKIKEYYKNNPAYPSDFYNKIQMYVVFNSGRNGFDIRSNLEELFLDIYSLEQQVRYRGYKH